MSVKKLLASPLIDIVLLLIISIFFSFYHLEKLYGFEFDQERDFNIVSSMIVDHKFTLIGPRVVSSAGFYLGPWYYYIQIPFFVAFAGNPIYGAVFTGFTSVIICLLIYFVIKHETSSRLLGLPAAVVWVGSANRSNWNVAFVPFFFLLFIHLYWQLAKKKKFLTFLLLTLTLSFSLNFHPQMIFLTPLWLYAAVKYYLSAKKNFIKEFIFTVLVIFSTIIPLIFFDLRHNFVNTNAAINFLGSSALKNSAVPVFRLAYSLRQFSTSLAAIHPYFIHNLPATIIILFAALAFCLCYRRYFPLILVTLLSVFVLAFYREATWPEYYHFLGGFSLLLLVFIAGSKIPILKLPLLILTIFMLWSNYRFLTSYTYPGSYYYKKGAILYMLSANRPYSKLNIVNNFKYGEGLGFLPIREFYEPKTGEYNPNLKFLVSYADNPKHNSTKKVFGAYAISLLRE